MSEKVRQNILIVSGTMLTAFAISVFYVPNKIVSGGVSGMSTILYHILNIPTGISYAAINVFLLICAYKIIGREFVLKTLLGTGLISVFIEAFSYIPPITDNLFLASVFGAGLYGLGIAIALSQNASTGGTDIIGRILQHFSPSMHIGTALLIVDFTVIFSSLLAFGNIDLSLWGIAALFISSFSIDWFIRRLNVSKLAFVITDKGEELAKYLVSTSPRGVTIINSVGAYTMTEKEVLLCALKEKEMPQFQSKIISLDKDAFIVYSESQQIFGNGFILYR